MCNDPAAGRVGTDSTEVSGRCPKFAESRSRFSPGTRRGAKAVIDSQGSCGEAAGTRTQDPRLKRPMLYRLSYRPLRPVLRLFYPTLIKPRCSKSHELGLGFRRAVFRKLKQSANFLLPRNCWENKHLCRLPGHSAVPPVAGNSIATASPGLALCACSRPLCSRTARRAMASPRPVPPLVRLRSACTR